MQTFLPHASFMESAHCLDRQRLGKQRVEAKQMLMALEQGPFVLRNSHTRTTAWKQALDKKETGFRVIATPWYNHPCTQMWKGYEVALATYGYCICDEWKRRGYADTTQPFFSSIMGRSLAVWPHWLGDVAFHRSHQSNLVRKFPEHYRKFFPDVPDDLEYIWPIMGDLK